MVKLLLAPVKITEKKLEINLFSILVKNLLILLCIATLPFSNIVAFLIQRKVLLVKFSTTFLRSFTANFTAFLFTYSLSLKSRLNNICSSKWNFDKANLVFILKKTLNDSRFFFNLPNWNFWTFKAWEKGITTN